MPSEWRGLPWKTLKKAAYDRGLHPPDVKGMEAGQRDKVTEETALSLLEWEDAWGDTRRTAPELLDEEEVAQEATFLRLEFEIEDSPKTIRSRVIAAHIAMQRAAVTKPTAELESDDDDEAEELWFDHPDGLPLTNGCGKSQRLTPLPKRGSTPKEEGNHTPTEEDLLPIFSVIVEHKSIRGLPFYDGHSSEVVMEVKLITGFWEDCRPDAISYEAYSRHTGRKSRISAAALHEMPNHDSLITANSWGAKELLARCDEATGATSPHTSASVHSTPHSVNAKGFRTSVLSFATWLSVTKEDPASPCTGLFSLPKVLTRDGHEATNRRPSAMIGGAPEGELSPSDRLALLKTALDQEKTTPKPPFTPTKVVDADETEHMRKTKEVQAYLSDALGCYVDAIERRHEPYVQPKDVNLYTDEPLEPRLTSAEKLDDIMSAHSAANATRNICGLCVICTWHNIQYAIAHEAGFDPKDPEMIKCCIAYADHPRETGCKKCTSLHGLVQPLHPNLFTPTACVVCSEILHCDGRIYMGCPFCKTSFVVPLKDEKPSVKPSMGTDKKEYQMDEMLYQYLRLMGGPNASLLGAATTLLEGRQKLKSMATDLYQEARNYIITPRLIFYGTKAMFGSEPDGSNGAVPRDYQQFRWQDTLLDEDGEVDPNVAYYKSIKQDLMELTSMDKLPNLIKTKYSKAPAWSSAATESTLNAEAVLKVALDNMGDFLVGLGENRQSDFDQTRRALLAETRGLNAIEVATLEHKICLTFYTFWERNREQVQDFSVNRLFPFELRAGFTTKVNGVDFTFEGFGIRLFYAKTMPHILHQVHLMAERKLQSLGTKQTYCGRYNQGGAGLSCEAPSAKDTGKSSKPKKAQGKTAAGPEPPTGSPTDTAATDLLDTRITIPAGGICGDRLPTPRKMAALMPWVHDKRQVCIRALSSSCPFGKTEDSLPCSYTHYDTDQLPPDMARIVLSSGGLPAWRLGTFKEFISWLPRQSYPEHMSAERLNSYLLRHIDKNLEKLTDGGIEKRGMEKMVKGNGVLAKYRIADSSSPIKLYSRTGVFAHRVDAVTLGSGNLYVDGNAWDHGDEIKLCNGLIAHNRCIPLALSSQLRLDRNYTQQPGANLPLELARQINEGLIACIDEMLRQVDAGKCGLVNRAGEIILNSANPETNGYEDAILDIIKLPALIGRTVAGFQTGLLTSNERQGIGLRVWVPGEVIQVPRHSWDGTGSKIARWLKKWRFGHAAECGDLVSTLTTYNTEQAGSRRHMSGYQLPKGQRSFNSFMEFVRHGLQYGKSAFEVRIMSMGQLNALLTEESGTNYTKMDLLRARESLVADLEFLSKGSLPDLANPYWKWSLREVDDPVPSRPETTLEGDPVDSELRNLTMSAPGTNSTKSSETIGATNCSSTRNTCNGGLSDIACRVGWTSDHLLVPENGGVGGMKPPLQPDNGQRPPTACSVETEAEAGPPHLAAARSQLPPLGSARAPASMNVVPPKLDFAKAFPTPHIPVRNASGKFAPSHIELVSDSELERAAIMGGTASGRAALAYIEACEEVTVDPSTPDAHTKAAMTTAQAAAAWYDVEKRQPADPAQTDLPVYTRMFNIWRYIKYGGLARDSIDPKDMPPDVMNSLSEGHEEAWREMTHLGHHLTRLGPKEGYVGDTRDSAMEATSQIHKSYFKLAKLGRTLNFPSSRKDILAELLENGGKVCPLAAVPKLDDRRRPRIDPDTKQPEMRTISDHTDCGHMHAANTGTWSYQAPKQLTTDDASIASTIIAEENANPGYFLRAIKGDYSGAFTINALHQDAIGELASEHQGILSIHGTDTFGGRRAPGFWEVTGSVASEGIHTIEWPNPAQDGAVLPHHTRTVDDTLHFVAMRGQRAERYWDWFTHLMKVSAGPTAFNTDKDAEGGGFTNYQHGFGTLADCIRRRLSTPFSRLCRSEDKIYTYLTDRKARIKYGDLPSLAGSLRATLGKGSRLLGLFMPRLDAMAGDAARKFGTKVPSDYEPSAALDGESEEIAQAFLRAGMEFAWRLATIEDGKYLYRSLEECLPTHYRNQFPGKEGPDTVKDFEMDCSGLGYGFIDPQTLKTYRHLYDEATLEVFNNFARDDHGIIISNGEFEPLITCLPIAVFDHPGIKQARVREDNTNVIDALNQQTAANWKNLDCVFYLGGFSYVTGIDVNPEYVKSLDNTRADTNSRPDLEKEWEEAIARLEAYTGKTRSELIVEKEACDLSHWLIEPNEHTVHTRVDAIFNKLLLRFEWIKAQNHPTKVPIDLAISCLKSALAGEPIVPLNRDRDDYPALEGPSKARQLLCPIDGKAKVRTRHSIGKALERGQTTMEALREEVRSVGHHEEWCTDEQIFNVIMQIEADRRKILWVPSEAYDPKRKADKEVKLLPGIKGLLPSPQVAVAEYYAGTASVSKGFRDCGDMVIKALAEKNSEYYRYYNRLFPKAMLFRNNAELHGGELYRHRIEIGVICPDCQEFSPGNPKGKGNAGTVGTGMGYEQAIVPLTKALDRHREELGVAMIFTECGVGVLQKAPGAKTSAYDQLCANSPMYFEAWPERTTRAGTVQSPLTGHVAPVNHTRAYSVRLHKLCFHPDLRIELVRSEEPRSCASFLCTSEETPGMYCMPTEDIIDGTHEHQVASGGHMTRVFTIYKPPHGVGEGSFPSVAYDPTQGQAPTYTNGGGKWLLRPHNGLPAFTHVMNEEAGGMYGHRDLEPDWREHQSEFGRHAISHSVVGSVGDAFAVAMRDLYLTPHTLEQSKYFGYDFCVSPRDIFLHLRDGKVPSPPPEDGETTETDEEAVSPPLPQSECPFETQVLLEGSSPLRPKPRKFGSGLSSIPEFFSDGIVESTEVVESPKATTAPQDTTEGVTPPSDEIAEAVEMLAEAKTATKPRHDPSPTTWEDPIVVSSTTSSDEEQLLGADGNSEEFWVRFSRSPERHLDEMGFNDSSPEEQATKRRITFAGEQKAGPQKKERQPPRGHKNWDWDKPQSSSIAVYNDKRAANKIHVMADRPRRSAGPPAFELTTASEEAAHLEQRKVACHQKAHLLPDACMDQGALSSAEAPQGQLHIVTGGPKRPKIRSKTKARATAKLLARGKSAQGKNASGPEPRPEPKSVAQLHATRDLRERLKNVAREQHRRKAAEKLAKAVVTSPDRAIQVPVYTAKAAPQGSKRKAPEITADMSTRITKRLMTVDTSKKGRTLDARQADYVNFARQEKWDPLITDPTDPAQQQLLKRWIAYEKFEKGNKAKTIEQKMPAINRYHTDRGHLPVFKYATIARDYLKELGKLDPPAQPRLPVPPELTILYQLTSRNDPSPWNVFINATCMNVHRDWCMRSAEGMAPDSGPMDSRSLQWRDVIFKENHTRVSGEEVLKTTRITLSLRSTKNALGRCTRTVPLLDDISNSGAVMLRNLYLGYIAKYGHTPPDHEPVFLYENGQPVRRKDIAKIIQDLMLSVGVPKHLVGSHSLRRGGASMYLAAGMPESSIKSFGRWTSDAYKLYLIIDSTALDAYARKAATVQPRFEMQ